MTSADGAVLGMTKIVDHGPAEDCWNVVIMSDGFQTSQLPDFATDAQGFADTLLATPPFDRYQRAINVFRVDVSSTDAGADDPCGTGATARTFFDATLCGFGVARLLVVDEAAALAVAAAQVPQFHMGMVMVNTADYGGSGGSVAVFSRHADSREIALHEMGHTAFNLGDEYDNLLGCGQETDHDMHSGMEPGRPNVTIDSSRATNKWRDLIDATTPLPTTRNPDCTQCDSQPSPAPVGTIGAFEGADYFHCGAFRPAHNCRMNDLGNPYCRVCQRVIARRLASFLPPTVEVAVLAVDQRVKDGYLDAIAASDFVTALSAVTGTLRPFGYVTFEPQSADPAIAAELTDVRTQMLTTFPAPAVGLVTYFSPAGDPDAGSLAVRDARRKLVSDAVTTATSFGAGSIADQSVEVGQVAFDVARSRGITQSAIMVVDLAFKPVSVAVLAVADSQLLSQFGAQVAQNDFVGAMGTACQQLHLLGRPSFEGESATTIPDSALAGLGPRFTALFPGATGIFSSVLHLSRTGDRAAGTPAARDRRVIALTRATTTLSGGFGIAPGVGVHEVAPAVFDVAKAAGVPDSDVIAVVTPSIIV